MRRIGHQTRAIRFVHRFRKIVPSFKKSRGTSAISFSCSDISTVCSGNRGVRNSGLSMERGWKYLGSPFKKSDCRKGVPLGSSPAIGFCRSGGFVARLSEAEPHFRLFLTCLVSTKLNLTSSPPHLLSSFSFPLPFSSSPSSPKQSSVSLTSPLDPPALPLCPLFAIVEVHSSKSRQTKLGQARELASGRVMWG